MTIPPLLNEATLAAIRAPFLQYLAQAGQGPEWNATRQTGRGVGTPKTPTSVGTIEGWVLVPPATQPTTGPGQKAVATAPQLYVVGDVEPQRGDVIALAEDAQVRYRVVGETQSLLYPTYIVEAL